MDANSVSEKAIFVKSGHSIKRVLSSEILYVQCEANVSRLFMLDGSELVCVRLLKLFEQDLDGAGFLRINHNVLVNLSEIQEIRYVNARKRQVVLTGEELEICCLYALGLNGKTIQQYTGDSRHYQNVGIIRKKLGLGEHDKNINGYINSLKTK